MQRLFRVLNPWCCQHKFEWLGAELPSFCPACGWPLKPNKLVDVLFSILINESNIEMVLGTVELRGEEWNLPKEPIT